MPQFSELDKLLRIISRSSEVVSKKVSRQVQELAYAYLDRLEVLSNGKISNSSENRKILKQLKSDVMKFLKKSGMDKSMAKSVMAHYELMRKTIEKINESTGIEVPSGFLSEFRDYKADAYKQLLGKMGESNTSMQNGVRGAINKFAISGKDFIRLKTEINNQVDRIYHSNTISVTAAMTIINQGNEIVADISGLTNRKCLGPVDKLRRPFCEYFVGKVVKNEWLDKLKNGQGLPVRSNCGGFNCRHIWIGESSEPSWDKLTEISPKWRS